MAKWMSCLFILALLRRDDAALVAESRDPNPHIQRQARDDKDERAGHCERDLTTFLDCWGGNTSCTRDSNAEIPLHRMRVSAMPGSSSIN